MKYTQSQQLLARQRLESRSQGFSNIDGLQQPKVDEIRNMLPGLSFGLTDDDMGTNASLLWTKNFRFIKGIQVHAKSSTNQEKYIATLYTNTKETEPTTHDYALFTYGRSSARIRINLHPSEDSLAIYSMNNHKSDFRCGTFLMQLAVELSLVHGYEGRIYLSSARGSGQFYFKLGFLPENPKVYDDLLNGKDTDGGPMSLPQPAIEAWKKIIKRNPILPETCQYLSKQEGSMHIQGNASEEEQPKKIPLNLILSKLNQEHISRLVKISGTLGLITSIAAFFVLPLSVTLGIGCSLTLGTGIVGLARIRYLHSLMIDRINNQPAPQNLPFTPEEQIAYTQGQKATSWLGYFSICSDRHAWRYSKATYCGLIDAQRDRYLSEVNAQRKAKKRN